MREIKFKFWDKSRKQMLDDVRMHGMVNRKLQSSNLLSLQYTGLKDKNGKELYDGDIYRKWGEVCKCDFEQTIYEKMECLIFDGDFEVIGSIYENPELMQER